MFECFIKEKRYKMQPPWWFKFQIWCEFNIYLHYELKQVKLTIDDVANLATLPTAEFDMKKV